MAYDVVNLDTGAQVRTFGHGTISVATFGETTIGRAVFSPGWRWSADVAPTAGTASCQAAHAGVVLAGRFGVRMDDGTEFELGPGDAHLVAPGHDAWVIGDEECVIIDVGTAPDGSPGPEEVVRAYFDAFSRGDADEILGLFTDDAAVAAEGMPATAGRGPLKDVYDGFFAAMSAQAVPVVDSVARAGGLAVVRTHSSGTLTVRQTGQRSPAAFREMFELRRGPHGWRISGYLFNAAPAGG
jgi:ketosteroid isomerase-like protein